MKKNIGVIILIIIVLVTFLIIYKIRFTTQDPVEQSIPTSSVQNTNNSIVADKNFTDGIYNISYYKEFGITSISTDGDFDFNYIPTNVPLLKDLAREKDYKYLLNGTFFGGNYTEAVHAGLLNYYGKIITPIKTDNAVKQLTHIMQYNRLTNKIQFFDAKTTEPTVNENILEFQTGPLILLNNEIQHDAIFYSNNGRSKHERTIMGVEHNGTRKVFFLVQTKMSLEEFSNIFLKIEEFKNKKFDLINLDGGPSTSLVSKNYPELNINADKPRPITIGLK